MASERGVAGGARSSSQFRSTCGDRNRSSEKPCPPQKPTLARLEGFHRRDPLPSPPEARIKTSSPTPASIYARIRGSGKCFAPPPCIGEYAVDQVVMVPELELLRIVGGTPRRICRAAASLAPGPAHPVGPSAQTHYAAPPCLQRSAASVIVPESNHRSPPAGKVPARDTPHAAKGRTKP